MKKNFATFLVILALLLFTAPGIAQDKTMPLNSKSKKAKELVTKATEHALNVEFELAYLELKAALDIDPNITIALAGMASMTNGETRKTYAEKAANSAKTEGEKLLASTVATGSTFEKNREVWVKLHDMYPDDAFITFNYIFSKKREDQLAPAEEYMKKFPDQAWIYNVLSYHYIQVKKDTATAKTYFEKYIQMHPDGYNPYDSMGEFYFMTGDLANSEKYYNMALEKYPFVVSSIDKLKEIKALKDKEAK